MATEKWVADAYQLLTEIERIYEDHYSRSYNQCVHDIFNAMRRIVRRNATFRTVEVVHGRWVATPVYKFNRLGKLIYYCDNRHCSECKTERPIVPPYNYCPNCGAKMDGDGNG